jgi:hypothetical protein
MYTNINARLALSADPLDTDVSSIDTSFPRALPNIYEMTVDDAQTRPNKAGTGNNLVLKLKSLSEVPTTDGGTLPGGSFTLTHNVSLAPTEKYTPTNIAKNLAGIAQAAGLSGITPRQIIDSPMLLVGKTVRVKVGIRKETAEYPESNEVKQFVAMH